MSKFDASFCFFSLTLAYTLILVPFCLTLVATQSSLTGVVFRAVGMMYLVDLVRHEILMLAERQRPFTSLLIILLLLFARPG